MARSNVRLDLRGLEEVARSREVRAEIHSAAERVADNVRAQGIHVEGEPGDVPLPVKVYDDTTSDMNVNRATSRVVIAHASGKAVQAKHGALTKAAAQAGLEVGGASLLLDYVTRSGKKRKATQAQIDAWTRNR